MTSGPTDDAVWSNYGGQAGFVGWIAFTLTMLAVPVIVTVGQAGDPIGDRTTATGWALAVAFFGAFLFFLARTAAYMRRGLHRLQNIALDASGLWWRCGGDDTLIPWHYIAGVGVEMVGTHGDARVYTTLEIFLRDAELPADLHCYRSTGPAPIGLPAERLRYGFRRGSRQHIDVQQAVERYAPGTWIGIHRAAWRPWVNPGW